ncbi:hypothetical protein [Nioella aestuarii]|uniref:hypothetical protein n=1 Tax=Nioella aestuarii TaxID=1662864 RepID=UPI003D7F4C79
MTDVKDIRQEFLSDRPMTQTPQIHARHRLLMGLLFHVTWLSGPALLPLYGLYARASLQARGVEVVSLARGIELLVPLAIWAQPAFFVVAIITRNRIRKMASADPGAFRLGIYMGLGAYAGLVLAHGWFMLAMLLYDGPGGAAEAVYMIIALWMISIPYMIMITGFAALVGAGLVWVLFRRLHGN